MVPRSFAMIGFLFLALMVSQAAPPSERYWNSVLLNTPIPKAIRDILRTNFEDYKSTPLKVRKGGDLNEDACTKIMYCGADKTQYADPNITIFFLLDNMAPGTQMYLDFPKGENNAPSVPRYIVDSIPFSSKKFPEILNHLSIKPESIKAKILKRTIEICELPGIKGEDKFCSTSLESMIDFSISKLGKQLNAMSTEVQKENEMKKYTFMHGIKKLVDDGSVVCHKLNYPYAVFYCHLIPSTSVYLVPLGANDGSMAKAVAVCHKDTSAWDPNHVAFMALKVKPGTSAICHFLREDSVAWVHN